MTGDDEAARRDQDLASAGSEGHATNVAPDPVPEVVRPVGATASAEPAAPWRDAGQPPRPEPLQPAQPDPVSLTPVWIVMIVGWVILAGAGLYLFSLLPDPNRLSAAQAAVADLQSKVAALQARPAPPDVGGLTQRLDAADKRIEALAGQVDALRAKPAVAAAPAATNAEVAPLAAKLADLDQAVGSIRSSLPGVVKQGTAGLDDRLTALSSKVDALPKIDLGPLTARINALDARLKPIAAEYEAAKSPQRVTTVRENGSAAETRAAPLAVTAEAVQRAIDAGRPFADDVKVLARLGADPNLLAPLQAVAETGAPTTKDLRTDLAAIRDKIDAQAAPAPTGSYLDRLMSGAATMVQVRPLGSVVGDTPPAILARMDDELARDDTAAALAEWQKLPEADRELGKTLVERIRLREAARDAARAIGAKAIQAMASDQP